MDQTDPLFTIEKTLRILALSKDATAIYTTEELIIHFANDAMIGFWGKDRSVIGRSFIEAVPELVGQPFFDLLRKVWRTGETYRATDTAAQLKIDGKLQWFYYDFEYRAIKNEQGAVDCILHTATDVTARHFNRMAIDEGLIRERLLNEELTSANEELLAANEEISAANEALEYSRQQLVKLNSELEDHVKIRTAEAKAAHAEAERQRDSLHHFFMQAPAGICILNGPQMVFELVNPLYQAFFPGRELLGKPLLAALPELKDSLIPDILQRVYETGKAYEAHELLVPLAHTPGGPVEDRYFNFIYQARLNNQKKADGVLVFVIEVTDVIRGRQAVEQKEASLRSLVMHSHYALMILRGRDWVIEIANQQIANLWHKTVPEITGRKLMDVLPEIADQPFPALLTRVFTTGEPYSQGEEVLYLDLPDGKMEKYVSFYYDPMLDAAGAVDGIIVACEDITDKVRSRRALEGSYQEQQTINEELASINEELIATQGSLQQSIDDYERSEQRLRSFVDSAPFPIGVYIGREMRILLANRSIMDVWGKGYEVVGKLYAEVLPELENQDIFKQLDSVFGTGEPLHARNQRVDLVVDERLQSFFFNYSFTPLFDAEGQVYGVMNTAAEVTDLNLALQQVAQSERNLHSMILQAPVAMCMMIGPEHIIEVANQLMIELWGKPEADVRHRPVFEALPDARNQGLEALMANVYQRGEPVHASEMPVSLIRNGRQEIVYQNFVYQPYRAADGNVLGIIAITIDVTEQVLARHKIEQSEAELRETQRRLEKELEAGRLVERQKDDFIGMASHELKTPLTSLSAMLQVTGLKLKNNPDTFLAGAMDKAQLQVKRMTGMINGFLNVSRLESGKLVIEKHIFDLTALLEEMIGEISMTSPSHQIKLIPCTRLAVNADRGKIGSVITNLLSNAVKYAPKARKIEVNCKQVNGMAEVSVKDEGIGVGIDDIDKLFDRYYRVTSTHTRNIAGFGIGLYLSADIIKQHGGHIWAESELGKGSTFYFTLPLGH